MADIRITWDTQPPQVTVDGTAQPSTADSTDTYWIVDQALQLAKDKPVLDRNIDANEPVGNNELNRLRNNAATETLNGASHNAI